MAAVMSPRERRNQADCFFTEIFARAGDPEAARKYGRLLAPRQLRSFPGWPVPDAKHMAVINNRAVTKAWIAVKRAVDSQELVGVGTGFPHYPVARFEFTAGAVSDYAPLLAFCLDDVIYGGLARVVSHARSRFTREFPKEVDRDKVEVDLYPGDDGIELMRLANRFLSIEVTLWELARDGGFQGVAPYPVRYESARYLWSPRIAGTAFCLRCGTPIRYRRAGRSSGGRRSVPVCAPCLRNGSLRWPKHAVMSHTRGKWWLMCQYPCCDNAFVGAGQARFCDEHTPSRLAKAKRVRAA